MRDGHSSATPVARRLKQPTRTAARTRVGAFAKPWRKSRCRPYSVLLPVGFAVPFPLPETRCALTAPFHPCLGNTQRAAAVCSLWHCPWGCPRRMLSGTVCPGARTFLSGHLSVIAGAAVQPTDGIGMGRDEGYVKTGRFASRRGGLMGLLCVASGGGPHTLRQAALGLGRFRLGRHRLLVLLGVPGDQQFPHNLPGCRVGDAVDLRGAKVALECGHDLGGGDIVAAGDVDAVAVLAQHLLQLAY